jgi:hypothetical protein
VEWTEIDWWETYWLVKHHLQRDNFQVSSSLKHLVICHTCIFTHTHPLMTNPHLLDNEVNQLWIPKLVVATASSTQVERGPHMVDVSTALTNKALL